VRPEDLAGIEGFVAVAAERQRGVVSEHLDLDLGDERVDRAPVARHRFQTQQQRPRRSEISVRAFVERAGLVGEAARREAPKAGEGLKVDVAL